MGSLPASNPSLADATVVGPADVQSCIDCSRPLVGVRRGRTTRRSYPCVPPAPPDPTTGLTPRLCERCWRRARYHAPGDTYRQQTRDKQRRWYEKRARGAKGGARGGATRAARGATKAAGSPKRPAAATVTVVPRSAPPAPARRVSSAQRLLAGR